MTYQNIMIDRIKVLIDTVDCSTGYCPFQNDCLPNEPHCDKLKEWLNEQYI